MNTSTATAYFNAPRDKVFAYLVDIENMPQWATSFCKELRKDGDGHKIVTPEGEIFFRIDGDAKTGVCDMSGGPDKDAMLTWPVRIAEMPDGGSLLMFTAIQTPGKSDEDFAAECRELKAEFENIRLAVE